jgi:membrane-associated phospholipid phosphatase
MSLIRRPLGGRLGGISTRFHALFYSDCNPDRRNSHHEKIMEFLQGIDDGFWNFLQFAVRQRAPWIDGVVALLRWLDNLWVLLALFALFTLLALGRREVRTAIFVLAAFAGGGVLAWGTQMLVARERPSGVINVIEFPITAWGFPSEHALLATVTYLSIALAAGGWYPRQQGKILAAACVLVFLLGGNRMLIGICFPTDVLAGWLGGISWVLFCSWWGERWGELV